MKLKRSMLINDKLTLDWWFVISMMFFNTVFLLALANRDSLWIDELFSINIADKSSTLAELLKRASWDSTNGPFYPIIHYYWLKVVGPYEIGLRALSIFFSTCAIPFFYYAVKNLVSTTTARIAVPFLILHDKYIQNVVEARAYALSILLCIVLLYLYSSFYSKQWRKLSLKEELSYTLTMLLLSLSHYYGIFFIMTLALASIISYPKKTVLLLRPYIISGLLFTILWGRVLFSAVETNYLQFFLPPGKSILDYFYESVFTIRSTYMATAVVLVLILGSVMTVKKKNYRWNNVLLVWLFLTIPFLIAYLISVVKIWILGHRYFVLIAPLLSVTIALAFEGWWLFIKRFISENIYNMALKAYIVACFFSVFALFAYKFEHTSYYGGGYRALVTLWQNNEMFDHDTSFFDPITADYFNIFFSRTGDDRRVEPLGDLDSTLSEAAIQQALAMHRSPYNNYRLPEGDYKNAVIVNVPLDKLNYDGSTWQVLYKDERYMRGGWIWLQRLEG